MDPLKIDLPNSIAEHVNAFTVHSKDTSKIKLVIHSYAKQQCPAEFDQGKLVAKLEGLLAASEAFQNDLAESLEWKTPQSDGPALVLKALNYARGEDDKVDKIDPALFGKTLDWPAWKLNPNLRLIRSIFDGNPTVRTAFAQASKSYPGRKHLSELAVRAIDEKLTHGKYGKAVTKVFSRYILNWVAFRRGLQNDQFLTALREDFKFRQLIVEATSYISEEAKNLASLATDMLRAAPPKSLIGVDRAELITCIKNEKALADLTSLLPLLEQTPELIDWWRIRDELALAFAIDPDLSSVLWKTLKWPYPFALVLREEIRQIDQRRTSVWAIPATDSREAVDVSDLAAQRELLGLAFSGGGIRSATFNLGVLQKLAEFGLLDRIDYLSTVSGGGYIGGWLAAWIHNEKLTNPTQQVAIVQDSLSPRVSPDPRANSQRSIQFLRDFSNYLTPNLGAFSFDTWTMVAVYTRNVLLNQATLFSLLGALLLFPRFLALPMLGNALAWGGSDIWMVIVAAILLLTGVVCMSLNMNRATQGLGGDAQASAEQVADCQSKPSQSPYTSFKGFFGTVWIQISVVATLLVAVFLGSLWIWRNIDNDRDNFIDLWNHWWIAPALFFFSLSFVLAYFGGFWRCYGVRFRKREDISAWEKTPVTAVLAAACASLSLGLLRVYLEVMIKLRQDRVAGPWHAEIWGPVMFLAVLVVPGILQVGLMGVDFPDSGREWISRFRAVCTVYTIYWVALLSATIYGPLLLFKLTALGYHLVPGLTATWVITTVSSFLAGSSKKTGQNKEGKPTFSWLQVLAKVGPPVFIVGLLIIIATLEQILFAYDQPLKHDRWLDAMGNHYWQFINPWSVFGAGNWMLIESFIGLSLAAAVLAWRVDINEFSMHHFYKNRLVRCYLGASHKNRQPNPFTGFDDNDDFLLSSLTATKNNYLGPYPLINTTLNLSVGKQLAWQERKAASFLFSPCFCGFDRSSLPEEDSLDVPPKDDTLRGCAYRETIGYMQRCGPNLGTAVSISGAAANPNQGYNTSAAVAFLMTVFNVRLGWWVGNPRRDRESKLSGPRFGMAALVSEMLGRTDDHTNFVNLSDGGFFDNMGIYELVRRRCKYIILCDAEEDALYRFGGLGMAIRRCRVDFGAHIDIDPARIKPKRDTGLSDSHCSVGTIRYLDGSRGTLVYIKTSVTGDEPEDVLEYRANQPHFPHESTADQWFEESQFESYRALGYHAADATLTPSSSWQPLKKDRTFVNKLFASLQEYWYPENPHLRDTASKHTATLADLLDTIRQNIGLQELGAQLFPNSFITPPVGKAQPIEEFYFCLSLIQLVEDIYFEFELDRTQWFDDPRIGGWRHLFRLWKGVPMVATTWAAESDTFRKDFQNFWNNRIC